MSAPEVTVFLAGDVDKGTVLGKIVEELSLSVDHVPAGSPFEFSAQYRMHGNYLLIEYDSDPRDIITKLREWEMPTAECKFILSNCQSSITIRYRGLLLVKRCLVTLSDIVGNISSICIAENGRGCLLRLSDVARCIANDPTWTWEREEFPEIAGVGPSEWRNLE
jgi:hypothetical protein